MDTFSQKVIIISKIWMVWQITDDSPFPSSNLLYLWSFVLPEMMRELNNIHIMLTVLKGYVFVSFLTELEITVDYWPFSGQVHHFGQVKSNC